MRDSDGRPLLSTAFFNNDIGKVAMMMSTMSSSAGAFEFLINPVLGKLSDAMGRKYFMLLGPLINIVGYLLVLLRPSIATVYIQRVVGVAMK